MDENSVNARKRLEAQLLDRAMKDAAFREELVRDPKAVFARELGISVPEHIKVEVVEERPGTAYLVLPQTPPSVGEELADEELETVAGGGWSDLTDGCSCGESCGQMLCPSADVCGS